MADYITIEYFACPKCGHCSFGSIYCHVCEPARRACELDWKAANGLEHTDLSPTPPAGMPRVLTHWFRNVQAAPGGRLVHDGDCSWFPSHVCTCGLLHALHRMPDQAATWYPEFSEQFGQHEKQLLSLHVYPYRATHLDFNVRLCAQVMGAAVLDSRLPGHTRTVEEIVNALLVVFTHEQVDRASAFLRTGQ